MKLTGVKSRNEYLNNPQAQEKYQNHLGQIYKKSIPTIKKKYNLTNVRDETLMMLMHYLGQGDLNVYLDSLKATKMRTGKPDYEAAQKAVNDSIISRTGSLPKNLPILDYINKFNSKLK